MEINNTYTKVLKEHEKLGKRAESAKEKLENIRVEFVKIKNITEKKPISIFCAGSLGREDVGELSDLDLFILAEDQGESLSRLWEVEVLASIIDINRNLGFKEFSNDGQYLKFYSVKQMLAAVGSPRDDSENLFTARMLLLLESKPICSELMYEKFIDDVIEHYFRDSRGKRSFRPLFLINDILRYWRTLCLNYEMIRDNNAKPWRKKNINLKFSRMLTVFGTLLPIIAKPISTPECVKELTKKTPNERFAYGLDLLNDDSLLKDYEIILDYYEAFLSLKEKMGSAQEIDDKLIDDEIRMKAGEFSDFIYRTVTHENIDEEFRKYLIL